jgi:hypothetical protein
MSIFIANRFSNGNALFPTEVHIDEHNIKIIKPGPISSRRKTFDYKNITSVEVISPFFGFSKVVISAFGLDKILIEGFERRDAELIEYEIMKNKRG